MLFDGTGIEMIPFKSGSGTPPALHAAIAISAASYSGGIITITTAAHGLAAGVYRIKVSGITGATVLNGYNGTFDAIYGSATTLKYAVSADPGAATITNGRFTRYYQLSQATASAINITAASTTGAAIPYIATITAASHGLAVGDWVVIAGVTPAGYNGTFSVRSVSGNDFTVWLGATATAGTVFGTSRKQVRASFQSMWASWTALPNPTGTNGAVAMSANGWLKVKEVQGGSFTAGALTWEGGTSPAATALGPEVTSWIEIAGAETGNMTVPRLGRFDVTGAWFYPLSTVTRTSTSITNSTTTATLTFVAHGCTIGSLITITGASPAAYNGTFEVASVPTADTLTYTMLSDPGGNATVQGDFYYQICCTGVANQTVQLPAPLANTYYSGCWIETSKGSGSYDYYPATGLAAGTGTASVGTEAARGKVVWMSTQGLIRIGHDGTNANGYVPAVGCRIRIPNVVMLNTLKAATVGANANAVPNTTLATRYDFTAQGGVINIDKAIMTWYPLFASPYSVQLTNTSISDAFQVSECATPMTLTDVGVGCTDATRTNVALTLTLCFAGGTFTRTCWNRNANGIVASYTDCFNFIHSDTIYRHMPLRTSATTALTLSATRVNNSTWTTTKWIGASPSFITCSNITCTTNSYMDVAGGVTGTTVGTYLFSASSNTNGMKYDGIDFGGVADVAPYAGLVTLLTAAQNIKIRNAGSAASPLALNTTNKCGAVAVSAANAGLNNIEFKRLYFSGQRAATPQFAAATWDNSINGVLCEDVWTGAASASSPVSLNTVMKGMGDTTIATAGRAAQYGYHFTDYFTSSTVGKIRILMNEKTASEPSASAYTIDTAGLYCSFDSAGSFLMPNINDQITWTTHVIMGHKSFPTTIPVVVTGTAATNVDLFYDISQGTGAFGGTFKNLLYQRPGGGGTSGTTGVTVTNTTGINVNDYIYGTGIGVSSKVQSITNSTTLVVTVNNSGTVSGTLTFSQLPMETITSATTGIRLKVRAKASLAGATTKLTDIAIATVCDATSEEAQYPLEVVNVTVTVKDASTLAAIQDARIRITTDTGGYLVLDGVTNSSGVLTGTTSYTSQNISGKVRRATVGLGALYKAGSIVGTIGTTDFATTVLLIPDA